MEKDIILLAINSIRYYFFSFLRIFLNFTGENMKMVELTINVFYKCWYLNSEGRANAEKSSPLTVAIFLSALRNSIQKTVVSLSFWLNILTKTCFLVFKKWLIMPLIEK